MRRRSGHRSCYRFRLDEFCALMRDGDLSKVIDGGFCCSSVVPFPSERGTERCTLDDQRRRCQPPAGRLVRPARSSGSSALPKRSLSTASAWRKHVL